MLLAGTAFAQAPANDLCSTAQVLTNGATTPGTTAGANDDLIGLVGCQSGSPLDVHPDVWYSLRATASQLDYVVTGGTATAPLEVFIYQGSCSRGLLLVDYACGAGAVTARVGALTNDSTYLISVASPSTASAGTFTVQATFSAPAILLSQDCNQSTILLNPTTFAQGVSNQGSGLDPNEVTISNSCWGNGGERQSKWFKFVAGTSGKLVFNIDPNNPTDDYDWGVWDVSSDPQGCGGKGNAIACNWTGQNGATGLSLCPSQEPGYLGGNQFDNTTTIQTGALAPIDIVAGRVYALLVDNYSTSNSGFTLRLGGACPNLPNIARIGIDAEFISTKSDCNSVVFYKSDFLTSGANNGVRSYLWNFGDGATSTSPTPIHQYEGSPTGTRSYTATLQIIDRLGNRITYTAPVLVDQTPQAEITTVEPGPFYYGDSVTLRASGGQSYQWLPVDGLAATTDSLVRVAPLTEESSYTLVAKRGECLDTVTFLLKILPLPVYNIITPNGDGKNETFSARVTALPIDVQIYTRWGRKVYDKKDYKQDWNGDDLAAGTYYYHIKATDGKTWRGWVEIVR